ncbi:tumor necrosis factor receptor superfamily member 5-like [Hypanus sabinus]|uniref:tumor necrosis factor receptor superfamily member 5-like n=1 Tax=Hypanus sabinus TaxID=79690 RepID=UPI0028C4A4BB|nr:tumor necrosis factor receptor superfamily member 5-like [Hypanus sabinus]
MGIPKLATLFAVSGYLNLMLSLVLMEASHVDDCTEWEYTHNGWCCPSCEAGMRVSEHCTRQFSTQCEQCPDGEYSDRYTGSDKCLECKPCDQELGLQTKENCTATRNTICEPREGYYCIDSCQMAGKHTECPPGEGVKEKGTPFNDTVCEKCPHGTFSSEASTTEECKNWTVCETLKLKQVEPGSAEADVKCKAEHNGIGTIHVVVTVAFIGIFLGIVAYVLWRKHKCKQGNRNILGTSMTKNGLQLESI